MSGFWAGLIIGLIVCWLCPVAAIGYRYPHQRKKERNLSCRLRAHVMAIVAGSICREGAATSLDVARRWHPLLLG
jgi:hypothetical protein